MEIRRTDRTFHSGNIRIRGQPLGFHIELKQDLSTRLIAIDVKLTLKPSSLQ